MSAVVMNCTGCSDHELENINMPRVEDTALYYYANYNDMSLHLSEPPSSLKLAALCYLPHLLGSAPLLPSNITRPLQLSI